MKTQESTPLQGSNVTFNHRTYVGEHGEALYDIIGFDNEVRHRMPEGLNKDLQRNGEQYEKSIQYQLSNLLKDEYKGILPTIDEIERRLRE